MNENPFTPGLDKLRKEQNPEKYPSGQDRKEQPTIIIDDGERPEKPRKDDPPSDRGVTEIKILGE